MQRERRFLLFAAAAAVVGMPAPARAQSLDAPNFIPVSPVLATSGQPTADALRTISAHGFQAVVYLAPGDVSTAVKAEPELLSAQGVEFVHIPIPFNAPDHSHVQALIDALDRLAPRKTLVHCEINMRASTMVFLYRVIRLRENPATAYESVARIWTPRGPWRRLVVEELASHGVSFEPY